MELTNQFAVTKICCRF